MRRRSAHISKPNINATEKSTIFQLFAGLTMAVIQGGYVRRIPIAKTKITTVIGLWIIIPSFVAVGLAKSAGLLYFGLFLFALCKYLSFNYLKQFHNYCRELKK